MRITALRDGGVLSATPHVERIDGANSEGFRDSVASLLGPDDGVLVLNLGELTYSSSAGLRAFLLIAGEMQCRGGKLILHSMAKPVRDVFTITGFDRIIEVARDAANAWRLAGD